MEPGAGGALYCVVLWCFQCTRMPCVVDLLGKSVFSSLQAVVDLNAGVLDKLAKLLLISMHLL